MKVGDRVVYNGEKYELGNNRISLTRGMKGTIVKSAFNCRVLCVEFDKNINGHSGEGFDSVGKYKEGHCFNFFDKYIRFLKIVRSNNKTGW